MLCTIHVFIHIHICFMYTLPHVILVVPLKFDREPESSARTSLICNNIIYYCIAKIEMRSIWCIKHFTPLINKIVTLLESHNIQILVVNSR